MTTKKRGIGASIWKTAASGKLAIVLLSLLAVASILGTLLPQGEPAARYEHQYRPALAKLILSLNLDDVYYSPWFLVLLFALAANLIACSIDRFPKTWRLARHVPDLNHSGLPNLSLKKELDVGSDPQTARSAVYSLAERLGSPLTGGSDQSTVIFAQSGGWSRLGAYVIHVAILILFAGGMITGWIGFKGRINIFEGQTLDYIIVGKQQKMPLDFKYRLDKFTYEVYKNGQPKTYRADLAFLQGGKEAAKAAVEVNSPFTFGRITFFMSHYGQEFGDRVKIGYQPVGGQEKLIELKMDAPNQVADLGTVKITGYSENYRGIGPAIRIEITKPGQAKPEVYLLFTRDPYQMPRRPGPKMRLADYNPIYYAGLQANYDPGVPWLWAGSIVMLLGLIAAFFWSHRRWWFEITPTDKGSRIVVAASTSRNKPALEKRFEQLCREIETSLAPTSQGN